MIALILDGPYKGKAIDVETSSFTIKGEDQDYKYHVGWYTLTDGNTGLKAVFTIAHTDNIHPTMFQIFSAAFTDDASSAMQVM